MKTKTALLALALAFAVASPVHADCVDGQRATTPEERAYAKKLEASLLAALPPAPAPLYMEREPTASSGVPCGRTAPVGRIHGSVNASYTASLVYSDRVTVDVRANHAYPEADDIVLGALPKNPAPFAVQNLVIRVQGHKPEYVEAVKAAFDRAHLQRLIDEPLPDTPAQAPWTVGPRASTSSTAPSNAASAAGESSRADAAPQPDAAPAGPEPARAVADKAKDAVRKLRGLFGR